MDQAAAVARVRRTEPLHVTVGGQSLPLQVIVHYDFVVPDPTVEVGQQSGGLVGDNRPLQVGPGKALLKQSMLRTASILSPTTAVRYTRVL